MKINDMHYWNSYKREPPSKPSSAPAGRNQYSIKYNIKKILTLEKEIYISKQNR